MDFYKAYDLDDRWAIAFTRDFDRAEPVVYFLDKKYKHTNVCGIECQITCGAYYVSTILGHKDGYDLCLACDVPAWTVPAETVALAKKYCQEELQEFYEVGYLSKPVKSSVMKYGDFLNKLREEGYPEEAISNVIADNAYMISENDQYSETDQRDFRRRLKYELKELEERGLYKPVKSRLDQSRRAIKSSDKDWLADVRRQYGKILPPRGYNPERPKNDERVFSPADEERIHELSKSIHNKIKKTVKIADPEGNGNWTITPMHEQLYVLKDDGTTELLEKLSVEDLEYIDSFRSLGMMKSSITSARRDEVDSIAANELALCTENDGNLYRQMTLPVIDNLKKKIAKGVYDEQLALKAWLNVVTAEARKYVREFGSPGDTIDRMFNLATREEAAKEVARYYEDHLYE